MGIEVHSTDEWFTITFASTSICVKHVKSRNQLPRQIMKGASNSRIVEQCYAWYCFTWCLTLLFLFWVSSWLQMLFMDLLLEKQSRNCFSSSENGVEVGNAVLFWEICTLLRNFHFKNYGGSWIREKCKYPFNHGLLYSPVLSGQYQSVL